MVSKIWSYEEGKKHKNNMAWSSSSIFTSIFFKYKINLLNSSRWFWKGIPSDSIQTFLQIEPIDEDFVIYKFFNLSHNPAAGASRKPPKVPHLTVTIILNSVPNPKCIFSLHETIELVKLPFPLGLSKTLAGITKLPFSLCID